MKLLLPLILAAAAVLPASAQTDTVSSGIYSITAGKLKGSTTDLAGLKAHASTLAPGKVNHPPRALPEDEELIFVKEGQLAATIGDTSRTLGPGSVVFILAKDVQSFANHSDKPVTYYVITLRGKKPLNIEQGRAGGGSMLIDWNQLVVKKTDKGESRAIFNRPTAFFHTLEIHATTLNGGQSSHPPHQHREEEVMVLMQGRLIAHIGDKDYPVETGEMVFVRPNVLHGVKNAGETPCWYYAFKWVE